MPGAAYSTQYELRQLFNELAREICARPIPGRPIFSQIYLDHPTRAAEHCRKLHRLALHSREFARSIKTINITEHPTTDDRRSRSWLAADNSLPQLIPLLESVSTLSISSSGGCLDWRTLPVKLSASFSSLFRRITSLELQRVESVPFIPFMSFSQLEHLELPYFISEEQHPLDLSFFDLSPGIQRKGVLTSLSVTTSFSAMNQLFHCLSHPNSRLDLSLVQFLEIGFCKDDEMSEACPELSAISQSAKHLDVRPTVYNPKESPLKYLNLRQFPNLLSLSHSIDCLYPAYFPEDHRNPLPFLLHQLRQIAHDSKIQDLYLDLDLTGITTDTDFITSEAETEEIEAALARLCHKELWGPLGKTLANFPVLEEVTISVEMRGSCTELYNRFCGGLSDGLGELSASGIRIIFVIA